MGANFFWSETNHAGPTGDVTDDIANLNFVNEDNPQKTPVSDYPITAGENSYEKYIRAGFTGSFVEITNMKFWKSAGDYKSYEEIKAAANKTYATPVGGTAVSVGATGDVPTGPIGALSIEPELGTTGITGPGYTKYILLQLQTGTTMAAGPVNQKTFTFQYDET